MNDVWPLIEVDINSWSSSNNVGWRQGLEKTLCSAAGGGEPQSQATGGADLFNKHGYKAMHKRLPLSAGPPRPCTTVAPPRSRPVRLMENWNHDDRNDTAGCLAPRAVRLEKCSQRAFLTQKRDYARYASLWTPAPFPRYPSTYIYIYIKSFPAARTL